MSGGAGKGNQVTRKTIVSEKYYARLDVLEPAIQENVQIWLTGKVKRGIFDIFFPLKIGTSFMEKLPIATYQHYRKKTAQFS